MEYLINFFQINKFNSFYSNENKQNKIKSLLSEEKALGEGEIMLKLSNDEKRGGEKREKAKEKVKEVKEFEQELVEMASHRLTIDLDDGVKANYPKFYPLVEPIKGLE